MGRFALKEDDEEDETRWDVVRFDGAVLQRDGFYQEDRAPEHQELASANLLATRDSPYSPKVSASFVSWKTAVGLTVLAWLVHQYVPPAPPLNNDYHTWSEFLATNAAQVMKSLHSLLVAAPLHISHWLLIGVTADIQLFFERRRSHPTSCVMRSTVTEVHMWDAFEKSMGGQKAAVALLMSTIQTWQWQRSTGSNENLVVFAAGFENVGKVYSIHSLARSVLFDDTKECIDPIKPILVIDGFEFGLGIQKEKIDLLNRVVSHLQVYPRGSIVVFRKIEYMHKSLLLWLLQLLREKRLRNEHTADDDYVVSGALAGLRCEHTVFVFTTSSVGKTALVHHLRTSGGADQDLLDASFISDFTSQVHTELGTSESLLPAVIPFVPLTKETLREVLQIQVTRLNEAHQSHWGELRFAPAVFDLVLHPSRVEYLVWSKRTSTSEQLEPFMTVVLNGAAVLNEHESPLWKWIMANTVQCLLSSEPRMDDRAEIDVVNSHIVFRFCKTAVPHQCEDVCVFRQSFVD